MLLQIHTSRYKPVASLGIKYVEGIGLKIAWSMTCRPPAVHMGECHEFEEPSTYPIRRENQPGRKGSRKQNFACHSRHGISHDPPLFGVSCSSAPSLTPRA